MPHWDTIQDGPFGPNWESLSQYEVPKWFRDAKFGIFTHWGPYSACRFENEWYPRLMYLHPIEKARAWELRHWDVPSFYEHHLKTHGPLDEFGYKDFIPLLTGSRFDPEEWVALFRDAGAGYVVPVAEHHDGFAMYDTRFSEWNAASMGPRRDVVAELEQATRAAGLHFGVSTHRANHWIYYAIDDAYDNADPRYAGLYGPARKQGDPESEEFLQDWFGRTLELIDRFAPELLFFDIGWHRAPYAPYRPRLAAHYYNHAAKHGYDPVLNYKKCFPDGTAVLDRERGKMHEILPHPWQTDTSISYKSWSYIDDEEFRTPTSLIHDLVDIVSKNGNLLLNVGPHPDGSIPEEPTRILRAMGGWLRVNGEAIYGTRPWWAYGEGSTKVPTGQLSERDQKPFTARDIRYTQSQDGHTLYATLLGWPEDGQATFELLGSDCGYQATPIREISMLGTDAPVVWEQTPGTLRVTVPEARPCDHAYCLRIRMPEATEELNHGH